LPGRALGIPKLRIQRSYLLLQLLQIRLDRADLLSLDCAKAILFNLDLPSQRSQLIPDCAEIRLVNCTVLMS